jgi:hypothetical protein
MIFFLLTIMILVLAIIVNYKIYRLNITTVAGASIMAMGIMIKGIFTEDITFPIVSDVLFYFMVLLTFWIIIHYTFDLIQGTFYTTHLEHPIASFSTGTWIAALSIMTIILSDRDIQLPAQIVFIVNLFIWLLYFGWMTRNYVLIFKGMKKYVHQIQGGLLLTCVASQSIVIAGTTTFSTKLPTSLAILLLLIGFCLYLLSLGLIVYRYNKIRNKNLTESWPNTNCIIHGALSITGVSLTFAYSEVIYVIQLIWVISFLLFLIIEFIEIIRCIQRVKKLGWKKGICIYSPTQWARVFTFGMLLFFAERIHVANDSLIDYLQNYVILYLPIMIIALILIEVILLSVELYKTMVRVGHVHLPIHEKGQNFPR